MKLKKISLPLIACLSLSITSAAFSCTRLLHTDSAQGVMVGRNMDWQEEMYSKLVVYPRGIQRQGYAPVNPLKWESRYGSIVATSYDIGATDGMNENGLAAHGLWLDESDYGARDEKIPGLSILMAIQFYLDNFKTVDEAVRYTESGTFQILPYYHPGTGRWAKAHLAIEDASGDSAIIEYIDGTAKIYHSREYTVLTNEPVYHLQLENLKQYDGFGGTKALPGTNESPDRFVRAAYHGLHLPKFSSPQEVVAGIFSVLQNATQPHETFKLDNTKIHSTIWRTVCDLTHLVYYFNSTPHMTTVYAELDKFNLQAGAPIMKLDLVKRNTLSGDVTSEFAAINQGAMPNKRL